MQCHLPHPCSTAQRARKCGATLVLTVAFVMILSSFHMFTQFGDFNTLQATSDVAKAPYNKSITTSAPVTARTSIPLQTTNLWSAVILTHWSQDGKHLIVENYNPISKKAAPLFSSLGDTTVDSVSHSGKNLIIIPITAFYSRRSILCFPVDSMM